MRHILSGALAAALSLLTPGCKQKKVETQATVEEPAQVQKASVVRMGDPTSAAQLLNGFHSIESGAWRWTQKQFAVSLRTPVGAGTSGATLTFRFTIPPVVIEKLHSITLNASAGGTSLGPQTYNAAGQYAYQRAVPAAVLNTGFVDVAFQLDKALPPGAADARELGIVAVSAGLEAK